MLPDRVSNPGPLTYESGALPIALRGPAAQIGAHIGMAYVRSFKRNPNDSYSGHEISKKERKKKTKRINHFQLEC